MIWGSILAGLVCGVLSGFGIGGGSLLMVWMTAVMGTEQQIAQGINLLGTQLSTFDAAAALAQALKAN